MPDTCRMTSTTTRLARLKDYGLICRAYSPRRSLDLHPSLRAVLAYGPRRWRSVAFRFPMTQTVSAIFSSVKRQLIAMRPGAPRADALLLTVSAKGH